MAEHGQLATPYFVLVGWFRKLLYKAKRFVIEIEKNRIPKKCLKWQN
jgi:hypothetical protein